MKKFIRKHWCLVFGFNLLILGFVLICIFCRGLFDPLRDLGFSFECGLVIFCLLIVGGSIPCIILDSLIAGDKVPEK